MSARNYHVYHADVDVLKDYAEQYEQMGRDTLIQGNHLTVFSGKKPVVVVKRVDRHRRGKVESRNKPSPKE